MLAEKNRGSKLRRYFLSLVHTVYSYPTNVSYTSQVIIFFSQPDLIEEHLKKAIQENDLEQNNVFS